VKFLLTGGQAADVTQGERLIQDVPFEVAIADKSFDSKRFVRAIRARGAQAVIPSRSNSRQQRPYDQDRYKDRNLAERFWNKIKQYRRVATRYEKMATSFLAMIHLASIMVLLR
jgi:transposase